MNKKIYAKPRAEVYDVTTEGMIAESLPLGTTDGDVQLTRRNPWDASQWSETEEEWE